MKNVARRWRIGRRVAALALVSFAAACATGPRYVPPAPDRSARLQGTRAVEAGRTRRRSRARRVVDRLPGRSVECPRSAADRVQPDAEGRGCAVHAGARAGARRRVRPHAAGGRRGLGCRKQSVRQQAEREQGVHAAVHRLHRARRCRLRSGRLGPGEPDHPGEPGHRAGERRRPREREPQSARRAGAELLRIARDRRGEADHRHERRRVRTRARADAEPVQGRPGVRRGRGAG